MSIYDLQKENSINENSKLLIGIGDSFCAGTGSESIDLWEKNDWDVEKMRRDQNATKEAFENSFINLLTKKYLTDYIPINLAMAGKGNRYAINQLYLNPTLNLEKAKEKIVIFVASGFERFDFIQSIFNGVESITHWPQYIEKDKVGYSVLKDDKGKSIYDDKFILSELILNFFHLKTWCERNNAKLLFISAFTRELDLDYLKNKLVETSYFNMEKITVSKLLANIPWDRQVKPMGQKTLVDALLFLEGREDLIESKFGIYHYIVDKHTENNYISKCQHPAKKGQEALCDLIYEYIKNYDRVELKNYEEILMEYYYSIYPAPYPETARFYNPKSTKII